MTKVVIAILVALFLLTRRSPAEPLGGTVVKDAPPRADENGLFTCLAWPICGVPPKKYGNGTIYPKVCGQIMPDGRRVFCR